MATIKNLTPHCVSIISEDGNVLTEIPSTGAARATQVAEPIGAINGIPLVKMAFGPTDGLPAPQDGTYYIVSTITAQAAKAEGRPVGDLLTTADPVRDTAGRIIGCRRLAQVS